MAAKFKCSSLLMNVVLVMSIYISTLTVIKASNGEFSIDLIYRDSPRSPFYNPSETPTQRLNNAVRRSFTRVNRLKPSSSVSPDALESTVTSNSGEYLMTVSVGTPPVEVLGIADTGSDLIWTQCLPCTSCYNQTLPIFNPADSSTYKNLSCDSNPCRNLDSSSCQEVCQYEYSYGDGSSTDGNLASETFTFGSNSLKNVAFGCGHNNGGTFDEHGSGLIGLGGGPLSLISQLGSSIEGKFSYCLVPLGSNSSSKLNFGSDAVVSGQGAVSTPIVPSDSKTFYYLSLEGFSVGSKRLGSSTGSVRGNIIIDSGTTLTLVPSDLYDELETAVKNAIDLEPVADPQGSLKLCYRTQKDIAVPVITAHFNGADVNLQPFNTFVRVQDDLVCFALVPTSDLAIFGNLSQLNFLVGYDLENNVVSFMPTDCTKQ